MKQRNIISLAIAGVLILIFAFAYQKNLLPGRADEETDAPKWRIEGFVKDEDGNAVADANVTCLDRSNTVWLDMAKTKSDSSGKYSCNVQTSSKEVYITAQKGNAWCDEMASFPGANKTTKAEDIIIHSDDVKSSKITATVGNPQSNQRLELTRAYPFDPIKFVKQVIPVEKDKTSYTFNNLPAGYFHVVLRDTSEGGSAKTALVDGESTDKVTFSGGCKPSTQRAENGVYRMLMFHEEVEFIGNFNKILDRAQANGYTHVLIYNHQPLIEALNTNSPKTAYYQSVSKAIRDRGMCVIVRGPSIWHPGRYYSKDLTLGSASISDGPRVFADIRKVSELKELWTFQAKNLAKMFGSDIGVLISNDESFLLPEPPAGKTVGDMLSDISQADLEAIRAAVPGAEIYTWSDMYSPWENATADASYRAQHDYLRKRHPANKYGARGALTNSWKWLENNKDVIVLNWAGTFYQKPNSFKHFADIGVRQVAVGYYDNNDNYCIQNILARAQQVGVSANSLYGVMFGVWEDKDLATKYNQHMITFSRLGNTISGCKSN